VTKENPPYLKVEYTASSEIIVQSFKDRRHQSRRCHCYPGNGNGARPPAGELPRKRASTVKTTEQNQLSTEKGSGRNSLEELS